jgi:hypothetical protein
MKDQEQESSVEAVTNEKRKKHPLDFEGLMFYFLLFLVIIGLPAASAIWLFSVV